MELYQFICADNFVDEYPQQRWGQVRICICIFIFESSIFVFVSVFDFIIRPVIVFVLVPVFDVFDQI